MKPLSYYQTLIQDRDFRLRLAEEIFLLEMTEALSQAMEQRQVTARSLAARMNISPTEVYNMLMGENLTPQAFARALYHLGYEAAITLRTIQEE